MHVSQKFYDFIVLLNSKYTYITTSTSELIDDGEDWRLFFKRDILKYIRSIRDYDLKELCIFFTDDFLNKKTDWSSFLVEKTILKTNSGGSIFYERINSYLDNKDIEMSRCYLMALKFGFTGYKDNPLKDEYDSYLSRFKSYFNMKNEIMLDQYEGDLLAHRSSKPIAIIVSFILLILVPIVVKIYYIILTFRYLNNCYLKWGY